MDVVSLFVILLVVTYLITFVTSPNELDHTLIVLRPQVVLLVKVILLVRVVYPFKYTFYVLCLGSVYSACYSPPSYTPKMLTAYCWD